MSSLLDVEQPSEYGKCLTDRIVADLSEEGALEHEIRTLATTYLIGYDSLDQFGIICSVQIKPQAGYFKHFIGQHLPEVGFGNYAPLSDANRLQRCPVISAFNTALSYLPIGQQQHRIARGEPSAGLVVISRSDSDDAVTTLPIMTSISAESSAEPGRYIRANGGGSGALRRMTSSVRSDLFTNKHLPPAAVASEALARLLLLLDPLNRV